MKKIKYRVGQRLISQAEPELGVGILSAVDGKRITVTFKGVEESRIYSSMTAPLVRDVIETGEEVSSDEETRLTIQSHEIRDDLYYYTVKNKKGGQSVYPEWELKAGITLLKPQEKLFRGQPDSPELFSLRAESLELRRKLTASKVRGLVGPRLQLLPHQLYIAQKTIQQQYPRVLLADEVGLGKTIEAGLIVHQLLVTDRVSRVLIVVPDALIYQWFVEMLRRFNLQFSLLDDDSEIKEDFFEGSQLWITSFEKLEKLEAKELAQKSSWDLLVVDEAHHMEWSPQEASPFYQWVESLSQTTKSLLLLTATPEQRGSYGHFARLRLLDPERFSDENTFNVEQSKYQELADLVSHLLSNEKTQDQKDRLLNYLSEKDLEAFDLSQSSECQRLARLLVDLWGTGRVYFRNSRVQMERDFDFFSERKPSPVPLKAGSKIQDKLDWMISQLKADTHHKYLVICRDKRTATRIETELKNHRFKTALFHEGLTLLERDRQAAYFAEEEGAKVLICSEIGSEGRNFQFVHHLILFDLPHSADLLEQRIGRLDRIGQKSSVNLLIPYIEGGEEELLYRFFHEGLRSFERFSRGVSLLSDEIKDQLKKGLENPKSVLEDEGFFVRVKEEHQGIESRLEEGRNRLLELNSFDRQVGTQLVNSIESESQPAQLRQYMEWVFDLLGVESDRIADLTDAIRPGDHMMVDVFPHLKEDGMSVTYDRNQALDREDLHFLTWDHPMVVGVVDMVLGGELGTACLAEWKEPGSPALFEINFVLDCPLKRSLRSDHLFPPTPIRVVVDPSRQDVTSQWPLEKIDQACKTMSREKRDALKAAPSSFVNEVVEVVEGMAQSKVKQIRQTYLSQMEQSYQSELKRLELLGSQLQEERESLAKQRDHLVRAFDHSHLRLDSIRLVF